MSNRTDLVLQALKEQRTGLIRALRYRLPVGLDADDIFQQTAERAVARAAELRDVEHVNAWLRRIFVRAAIDATRSPARREVPVGELPDEPDEGHAPTCGCSLTLLAGLPSTYAEILRRIDLEGTGVEEVAAALGITRSNVAVRLFRARRALRSRLEEHCGVTSSRECTRCVCAERGCCAT
ncbi:MAG: polymerase sigma 70 [Labilithrix sp.]|nr:polymerase sigma 70 [Labilithrix sp.]